MRILKTVGIALGVIIALLLMVPVFLPHTFDVERETVISAPPDRVFAEVNSFQKWENWSPWLERDKSIQNTYTGPESGVGNKVSWSSTESGDGSMEITEAVPYSYISSKLVLEDFTPFESHFTFNEVLNGTKVTWADSGSMGYLGRWMVIFADRMMGPDFEKGLANLKRHVESLPVNHVAVPDTIAAQ